MSLAWGLLVRTTQAGYREMYCEVYRVLTLFLWGRKKKMIFRSEHVQYKRNIDAVVFKLSPTNPIPNKVTNPC